MSALPPAPPRRQLGTSGISVSSLGWGNWRLTTGSPTVADVAWLVHEVRDAGIDLIDTADIYGFTGTGGFGDAEALLGEVFARDPGLRPGLVLATKGGIRPPLPYDQSNAYLSAAIDASLRRLRTERIDLYQIHRPDILAHPQEVARTLDDAIAAGKVRAVGVSNFTVAQTAALKGFLGDRLVATQPEISALKIDCFENGALDQAMALDLSPLAWSPLAGGQLASPVSDRAVAVATALDAVAETHGVSRTVAAYSWLMVHPARIIPIVGSQNPERIREATRAVDVRWTRAEWYSVLVASRGARLP